LKVISNKKCHPVFPLNFRDVPLEVRTFWRLNFERILLADDPVAKLLATTFYNREFFKRVKSLSQNVVNFTDEVRDIKIHIINKLPSKA
jgi:hypothetical protein